ncbi:MAG: hypothetical protein FD153_442 [Rhodospirillaceae bacterium]|nr:MAG: hypothetical protein FD153_442 [Rhodospirillaceae bacterium]
MAPAIDMKWSKTNNVTQEQFTALAHRYFKAQVAGAEGLLTGGPCRRRSMPTSGGWRQTLGSDAGTRIQMLDHWLVEIVEQDPNMIHAARTMHQPMAPCS